MVTPTMLSSVDLIVLVHDEGRDVLDRYSTSLSEAMGEGWSGKLILVESDAAPSTSSAARALLAGRFSNARRVLVSSRRNLGFYTGVNVGMAQAEAPYFGVFNPDGAAEPDTVATLIGVLEREPKALSVVATVPQRRAGGEMVEDADAAAVLWQSGVATLYRRSAFFELGGFDPLYFMYSGDSEFSQRARRAGWQLLRARDAVFHHSHADWGARRRFDRMRIFAVSSTTWSYVEARSRLALLRQLARKRAVWWARLARQRRFAQLAGSIVGTGWWPTRIPPAEHRRRHPWNQESFEEWLLETLLRLEVSDF